MVSRQTTLDRKRLHSIADNAVFLAQQREFARVRRILDTRPGLQPLFEAYALVIPESITAVDSRNVTKSTVFKSFQSVFMKSELLSMGSAMRLAHDFHIIPVLTSRQAVVTAFKKYKVVQKDSKSGTEKSGLTLDGFIRFLEGVGAASSMPALEKKLHRTERRAISLLDKFQYIMGEHVLATDSIGVLDLKLKLKMNERVYAFVSDNVPVLFEHLAEKKETAAKRAHERKELSKILSVRAERCRRWVRVCVCVCVCV